MPAYVIAEIQVNDPAKYEGYKKLTPGTLSMYGGKFIVRGGQTETLEGDRKTHRVVVLEFPTYEKAQAWYNSPEYQDAKKIRLEASTGQIILVDGVA